MRKKELALAVIERLKKEYPDSDCTLDYNEAWKLLISVRLAAQCTDARVNMIVPKLYEKFPDVNALADAPVEEIEEIVRPCGLGKSKARDINACMKMIRDQYNGEVPDDFDALLKLPGVGRKSANLIMGDVFGKPAIVTDTHCIRLSNRIGLVHGIKDPKKVEMELWKIILRKKAILSVTALSITDAQSAPPVLRLIATNAVWQTFVRKIYSYIFIKFFISVGIETENSIGFPVIGCGKEIL